MKRSLTLFALPKAFHAPFDVIQENALRSWSALSPSPEILLFGNDAGTAEAAKRFSVRHIPEIARNNLGTPLVDYLFRTATAHTNTPYQGYINADIILDPSLPALLEIIYSKHPHALIVSRRWDIDLHDALDFSSPQTFAKLAKHARTEGSLYTHLGMDVFIFPRGALDHMPPFSIGWPGAKYDNWMIYAARRHRLPVVDITDAITLVHQNHPTGSGQFSAEKAREHWINLDHLGGHGCCFDILDATHQAAADGTLSKTPYSRDRFRRDLFRFAQRTRYRARRHLLGFRYAEHA